MILGIFSDSLEQYRENLKKGEVDPCMIYCGRKTDSEKYGDIQLRIEKIEEAAREQRKKELLKQSLIGDFRKLCEIENYYQSSEKLLLRLKNTRTLQSVLVEGMVDEVLRDVQQAFAANLAIQNHLVEIVGRQKAEPYIVDETAMRKRWLCNLIESILYRLEQGDPYDTSSIRKIISDCAELIRFFDMSDYKMPAKEVVRYYLEQVYHISQSHCLCVNCHKALYKNFPYCLNCYERNA